MVVLENRIFSKVCLMKRHLVFWFCIFPIHAYADPLVDFKALVTQCIQSHQERPFVEVFPHSKNSSWVKRIYGIAQISYDVKRTDSLVSPYSAFLEVTQSVAGKSAIDEVSANALNVSLDDAGASLLVSRANFKFDEDAKEWVLTDGRLSILSRMKDKEDFDAKSGTSFHVTAKKLISDTTTFAKNCISVKR